VPQARCPPLAFICTLRLAVRHICQPTGVVSFSDGEIRVATTTLLGAPPLGSLHNTFRLSPPGTFCDVGQAEASPWVLTQPVEMYVPKPKCDMLGALSAPPPPNARAEVVLRTGTTRREELFPFPIVLSLLFGTPGGCQRDVATGPV